MPKYQHDCTRCVYLGPTAYTQSTGQQDVFDLYWCPQEAMGCPTVIARWSDEPSEYLSGMPEPKRHYYPEGYPLVIAWERARLLDLDTSV